MSLNLQGKKVLVTGSTDGLGRMLALELARQGASVTIHGPTQDGIESTIAELEEVNPKGKHDYVICDFSVPESLEVAFSGVSELDILINNAGVWAEEDMENIEAGRIIDTVNINFTSYLIMSRLMTPVLLKSDFGQILNTVSKAGTEISSDEFYTIYTATKFGLQGLTESMAKEFSGRKLRVMGFYPGRMDTKLREKGGAIKSSDDAAMDPREAVETIIFMLTRSPEVNVKRLDLYNHATD